jgi:4-methyl-5(b-hydroxyethyl)-thiazole monophosphate biosynthesis
MKRVLLLLCKGVEVYEATAFYDVLGWSGPHGGETVQVITAGLQREVRGTFGLRLIPDRMLLSVQPGDFDALAIPGGFEAHGFYEEAYAPAVADLIRRFDQLGKPVASICVGALALGNSGILQGRRATTYHLGDGARRKQLAAFGATVVDAPIVHDRNVITSTSPATAMEVAFELLARVTTPANANRVRQAMGFRAQG